MVPAIRDLVAVRVARALGAEADSTPVYPGLDHNRVIATNPVKHEIGISVTRPMSGPVHAREEIVELVLHGVGHGRDTPVGDRLFVIRVYTGHIVRRQVVGELASEARLSWILRVVQPWPEVGEAGRVSLDTIAEIGIRLAQSAMLLHPLLNTRPVHVAV